LVTRRRGRPTSQPRPGGLRGHDAVTRPPRRPHWRPTRASPRRTTADRSGYKDSNLGPPAPKAGALTKLRYIPLSAVPWPGGLGPARRLPPSALEDQAQRSHPRGDARPVGIAGFEPASSRSRSARPNPSWAISRWVPGLIAVRRAEPPVLLNDSRTRNAACDFPRLHATCVRVDHKGLEPLTACLQNRCTSSCASGPRASPRPCPV
jgi:hypothetical protein